MRRSERDDSDFGRGRGRQFERSDRRRRDDDEGGRGHSPRDRSREDREDRVDDPRQDSGRRRRDDNDDVGRGHNERDRENGGQRGYGRGHGVDRDIEHSRRFNMAGTSAGGAAGTGSGFDASAADGSSRGPRGFGSGGNGGSPGSSGSSGGSSGRGGGNGSEHGATRDTSGRGRGRGRGTQGHEGQSGPGLSAMEVEEGGRRGGHRATRLDRNDRFDLVRSRPAEIKSKKGISDQQVALIANFFTVEKSPTWRLYNYRVDFTPDEERTPIKKALLRAHAQSVGAYIFDGSTLWTVNRLSPDPMTLCTIRESDQERLQITIRLVAELEPGDVTYLQFYNIIVRKCLQELKFEELGRHFYDRHAAIPMQAQRLELWPGYITTMRGYESKLMLCVDVTHKVLNYDTCLHVIQKHHHQREAASAELIGSIVITRYNRKTYRIDDINWDLNPTSEFEMKSEMTSYVEYYRTKYGISITELRQPLLVSRPKRRDMHRGQTGPILLVPELCNMTGLSEATRTNFNTMRALACHLNQKPDQRMDNIRNFMRRMQNTPEIKEELQKWGLDFGKDLVQVPGRLLPKEKIFLRNPNPRQQTELKEIVPDDSADWQYALKDNHMLSSKRLDKWVMFVSQRDHQGVDNLIKLMSDVGRNMGFMVSRPLEIIRLNDTRAPAYRNAINNAIAKYQGKIDIMFAILPGNKLDLYAAIKKSCYIDYGIPSQCFQGKHLQNFKGLKSIATKVVIQMNAKMGGEPWAVNNPLKNSSTMVIGFDVHHCGKRRGPSVGAMVCTTNKGLTKFYSTVSFHNSDVELSGNLRTGITKCLRAFSTVMENEGNLPQRIIMYRDGVGQGQLAYVYNTELEQMKMALGEFYTSACKELPKFTLIIVTKKGNTRFATAPTPRNASGNPLPGTIVDDVITLPERWDFYLISQIARQGTVSPTAYNVIWDQQGMDADKLQRFTYKMTHLYYNWSGTVAVPATCQYAHKLAYLTGVALGDVAHENLAHSLYYL